jgi:translation initiation factor IF-2
LQKEKVRIYILARELDMESKDLLDLCKNHGIDVKNQLSSVEPEMRDQIVALVKRGSSAAPKTPQTPQLPKLPEPLKNLDSSRPPVIPPARPRRDPEPHTPRTSGPGAATPPAESVVPSPETPKTHVTTATLPPPSKTVEHPPARTHEPAPTARHVEPPAAPKVAEPPARAEKTAEPATPARHAETPPVPPSVPATPTAVQAPPARPGEQPAGKRPPETPATPTAGAPSAAPATPAAEQPPRQPVRPNVAGVPNMNTGNVVRDLNQRKQPSTGTGSGGGSTPGGGDRQRRDRTPPPPSRSGAGRIAQPPTPPSSVTRPRQEEKKPPPSGPKKLMEIPTGLSGKSDQPNIIAEIMKGQHQPGKPAAPVVPVTDVPVDDDDDEAAKDKKRRGPGQVVGRDARRKERDARQQTRKSTTPEVDLRRVAATGVLEEEQPRVRSHRRPEKKKKPMPTMPRKGKVPVEVPITVRSLSEAIGVRSTELVAKLFAQGITLTINSNLEPDMAELLAHDYGCELDIKKPLNAEEMLLGEQKKADNPEDLEPRAPVVTIMGHVDHGKTSLLDRIRRSNVVATEAGGITQVIRAWRVDHGGKPITFLDTPGHEAFTKMRARGANVTDIAVIVVAADDGVMPQTEEAIAHAKAAGVSIVVAINKVDLPNANLRKTEQQLYGLGLIPDNMGGEVPFVQTSAATGKGIDELLDTLSLVAELKDLKANPKKPGHGTCLEAYLSEGEGVLATLLIRDGTLHRGDVILCGASFGRIRAMYDDLGRPLQSAGPSVPVRITGLDEVPNADDPFMVVPDVVVAAQIGEKRKSKQRLAAQVGRKPVTLEDLREQQVTELKVILKAEARGSIEAIRKELEKLAHAEVRVRLLHAAIGGITESDVQLALTSPLDTLILGFNVVPDERARALAEEKSIQIKQYDIIYKLTDDIRAALEGKLKPREEIVHLGRAVVRETFKISKVGTIAGCYVTQGIIERSAKIRLIRSGAVVYPPPDRTASLESLKRFRDDAREVREGFECGMKIAGYDDIKVDDVIEAYRIEQVQRTLTGDA